MTHVLLMIKTAAIAYLTYIGFQASVAGFSIGLLQMQAETDGKSIQLFTAILIVALSVLLVELCVVTLKRFISRKREFYLVNTDSGQMLRKVKSANELNSLLHTLPENHQIVQIQTNQL